MQVFHTLSGRLLQPCNSLWGAQAIETLPALPYLEVAYLTFTRQRALHKGDSPALAHAL